MVIAELNASAESGLRAALLTRQADSLKKENILRQPLPARLRVPLAPRVGAFWVAGFCVEVIVA